MAAKQQYNATLETSTEPDPPVSSSKQTTPKPATPMMAQYIEIKAANPDSLLFYRMGDFYEMFFEDAIAAAEALDIQLTTRGKHLDQDIPMCGVPARAANDYLQRLIKKGFRVAVCDQLENPAEAKKRGSKSVVRRDVTRLVTAGTLTEDNLLNARENNYLAALARVKADPQGEFALAWLDISTGEFQTTVIPLSGIMSEITRLEPGELILPDTLLNNLEELELLVELATTLTPQPSARFDSAGGERALKNFFNIEALESFGDFSRAEKAACGALITYIELTQKGERPAIKPPLRRQASEFMTIDAATRSNLELVRTLKGERRGSLLSVIDRTVTGSGARKLNARLADPSVLPETINARLECVDFFLNNPACREHLRDKLKQYPDLNRALARLSVGRGSPRDLGALRQGLLLARSVPDILPGNDKTPIPDLIAIALGDIAKSRTDLADTLNDMLAQELPAQISDGGFVRAGYRPELDENRALRDESRKVIVSLQTSYRDKTDVKSLKVRHNNVLGYFIEVTAQHGDRLMAEPFTQEFIHRQTLANAVRFTTTELAELESNIMAAANRALAIEMGVFEHFSQAIKAEAQTITTIAEGLAELDVFAALAELAVAEKYTRPRIDRSLAFSIKAGRHPVVERALIADGGRGFMPNDCDLGAQSTQSAEQAERLWLLTGPNMAGKSTFLRQNALIAILAQMGSFVPAASAHIGVVDKIFSRVGAADDLARGRSTFMVEMVETATILNQSTERSLVILDEIGRGTATFDGLSIAWACVEHLHEVNKCRTLFATHFHELTALAGQLAGLSNVTMRVKEHDGEVIFLHEVAAGSADRSYGIQVAKLAGLPEAVLERAQDVLSTLEKQDRQNPAATLGDDLPLFSAARPKSSSAGPQGSSEVEKQLHDLLPDELTPREALDALYKLKAVLKTDK